MIRLTSRSGGASFAYDASILVQAVAEIAERRIDRRRRVVGGVGAGAATIGKHPYSRSIGPKVTKIEITIFLPVYFVSLRITQILEGRHCDIHKPYQNLYFVTPLHVVSLIEQYAVNPQIASEGLIGRSGLQSGPIEIYKEIKRGAGGCLDLAHAPQENIVH